MKIVLWLQGCYEKISTNFTDRVRSTSP